MKFRRPSHATVVAYLALFAAIGGGAYAASTVGTKDLKANAVTSPKIDGGAVRAGDVKRPVVRAERHTVPAGSPNTSPLVRARCKQGERLLSGGGGWDTGPASVLFSGPQTKEAPPGPVSDYIVRGTTSVTPNVLEARAVCLPK